MTSKHKFLEKILEGALKHQERGWSVVPIGLDKIPFPGFALKRYQTERATPARIAAWAKEYPSMNVGVMTGPISGIVVLDLDTKHNWSAKRLRELGHHIPPTASARTGNGGEHYLFKHPGFKIPSTQGQLSFGEGVDIRGDGGYIVAPPSFTAYMDKDGKPSGGEYKWIVPPEDGIADMPEWLVQEIEEQQNKKEDWRSLLHKDCPEGKRNGVATSIAGGLLRTTDVEKWEDDAWRSLQKWNQDHCKPPLPEKELRQVFDSIAKKEREKPKEASTSAKSASKAKNLAGLVVGNSDVELFHDEYDSAYARIIVNGHKENLPCKSRKFKLWLTGKIFDKYGSAPTPAAFNALLSTIESVAIFKSKKQELYNRVVRVDDAIWYDLADEKNRAVKITAHGWDVVNDPPTLFRREAHQLGQVEPVRGGDAKTLFRFVNVTDPDQQLLVLVYLVSCLIPGFPHPLLYIHGQQGSAKSTLSKIIRMLIDPSRTAVLILPKDTKELALQLTRHHLVFYENVSWISPATSDLLCIAVTGGSISKRMLYTDADDFFVNVQTNIGINGINIAAVQPDLLERTMLLGLGRVEDNNRKNEQELYAEFELERPKILGALFEAAAKAIATRPNMVLGTLPRMADFTQWGAAISEAFGYTKEEFLRVYNAKIREQSEEGLEASTEATALLRFMDSIEEQEWHDEPARLLAELKKTVNSSSEAEFAYGEELPKKASQLMKRLNVLKPNLRVAGIEMYSKKVNGRRHTFVRKIGAKTAQSVPAAPAPQQEGKSVDDTRDDIGQEIDSLSLDETFDFSPKDNRDDVDDEKGGEIPF